MDNLQNQNLMSIIFFKFNNTTFALKAIKLNKNAFNTYINAA